MEIELPETLDGCHRVIVDLQEALTSRDVIGQAKGILMAAEGIPADAAFLLLVRASQRENRKLRVVASDLVAATSARCHRKWLAAMHLAEEANRLETARAFEVHSSPGRLAVAGEVDMAVTAALLDALLCAGLAAGGPDLVVDLREVTFLDSMGISALVDARNRLAAEGVAMRVTNPNPFIRRTLAIAGVSDHLGVAPAAAAD